MAVRTVYWRTPLARPPRRDIREDPGRDQLCTILCILAPEILDTVCVRGRLPPMIDFFRLCVSLWLKFYPFLFSAFLPHFFSPALCSFLLGPLLNFHLILYASTKLNFILFTGRVNFCVYLAQFSHFARSINFGGLKIQSSYLCAITTISLWPYNSFILELPFH